jgi:outer membrane protein assembly factor BamB
MKSSLNLTTLALLTWVPVAAAQSVPPIQWPQFRGPNAAGVAEVGGQPVHGSATNNAAWRTAIPGRGWSSPIVWGERVFLTTVVNAGTSEVPKKGLYFGGDRPEPPATEHTWQVWCLDLERGLKQWEVTAHRAVPRTPIHLKSSYGLDGQLRWSLRGMSSIVIPTPVAGDGLLFVSSG